MAATGAFFATRHGWSAPPAVVSEIITALSGLGTVTVTERVTTTESVQFGLPREVRR